MDGSINNQEMLKNIMWDVLLIVSDYLSDQTTLGKEKNFRNFCPKMSISLPILGPITGFYF